MTSDMAEQWLRRTTLALICVLGLLCRLLPVVETDLHDVRAAQDLAAHAPSHPMLAVAASLASRLLSAAGVAVDMDVVCAAIGPVSAATGCALMYAIGKEVTDDAAVNMLAAALLALLPAGTVSTAQALGLTPLLVCILYYLRALKGGRIQQSVTSAAASSVALVLVALTWRAYAVYLALLIPLHVAYLLWSRCMWVWVCLCVCVWRGGCVGVGVGVCPGVCVCACVCMAASLTRFPRQPISVTTS